MPSRALLAALALALVSAGAVPRLVAAAAWTSPPDTSADYLAQSRVTNRSTSQSRCAKVRGATDPDGYSPAWRPINTPDSAAFWQTVRGPRNSYARAVEDADPDVWRFLGGAIQLFLSFRNRRGFDVSYFVGIDCVAWTANSRVLKEGATTFATGVLLAPNSTDTLLAYERTLPSLHPLEVTPVVLGMTPGLNFPIDNTAPWTDTDLDFTSRVDPGAIGKQRLLPALDKPVDGSSVTLAQWLAMRPTRAYTEDQCRDWIDENERLERNPTPPAALTGVLAGQVSCIASDQIEQAASALATEVFFSRNFVPEPLTLAQGLFLVIIPATWEVLIASILLWVRLTRKRAGFNAFLETSKWLLFELATLAVTVSEFGLLVSSTVEQKNWQPCQMGRFDLNEQSKSENGSLFGDEANFINVHGDAVALECIRDPGTDLAWAVVIGVVALLHVAILAFECVYVSSVKVRDQVSKSINFTRYSGVGTVDDDDDDDEDDDGDGGNGDKKERTMAEQAALPF